MTRILIIDDDQSVCEYLSMILEDSGYITESSFSLREGVSRCDQVKFDIVLLDVNLPDGNGLEAMPVIQSSDGHPEVIIITGEGDPDGAELAINSGAWDYIEKPLKMDSILLPIRRAALYHDEKRSAASLESFSLHGIIGNSFEIRESIAQATSAAKSGSNTLITGETGTGKELFARAIHLNSSRRKNEFVVVDCTSLPKNLIESILFGHKKGSFTGADESSTGLVELAHKGTLFLDEVGELPLSAQKSFLRVLQERKIRPVGEKKERESDFFLLSATNRNLDELVHQGKFRQDLLFRLRTFQIELPPLRNRKEDIGGVSSHYLHKLCKFHDLPEKKISDELLTALQDYDWPGNVRELIGVLENVVAKAGNSPILFPEHLPVAIRAKIVRYAIKSKEYDNREEEAVPQESDITLQPYKKFRENIFSRYEKPYLAKLMKAADWDIQKACAVSALSRSRLYELLKKHDISKTNT